ncbi:methyl farnesoate epoxidase [Anabrus simplex]|uniref:methyl farnesoate epoxidase n=1 Tax=Anabrus simplex TaxID=316456 RepID=UPI0035A329E2
MFFILLMTAGVLYMLYSWVTIRPKNFPPGPPCLPLIGSALSIPRKLIYLRMEEWRNKYGPVVGLMVTKFPIIVVCDPSTVIEVLKREELQGRPFSTQFKERSLNKRLGILFNDGAAWLEQRRFTLRQLKEFGFGKTSMEGLMVEEIQELIKEIKGKTLQVSGLFNLSAVNVLCGTMAGTRYKRNNPELCQLLENITRQFRGGNPSGATLRNILPFIEWIAPKLVIDQDFAEASRNLQNFMRKIIRQHEETLDEENPRDFIDVYLTEMHHQPKDSSSFSENSLVVICMDLFTAGAESVGNTLGFALLYMVLYPEVQEKVHEAIDSTIGRSHPPSLQDKARLPYIEAVLTEVQRCNTIAPLTPPHRATHDTELHGYFIPKNTTVLVSLWSLLNDKNHWGDPENFRPQRFLDNSGKFLKDEYLILFGVGKRLCPGEALARNTLFLFFTTLLQHFTIVLPENSPKPTTVPLSGFTVAPQPFKVTFNPRL